MYFDKFWLISHHCLFFSVQLYQSLLLLLKKKNSVLLVLSALSGTFYFCTGLFSVDFVLFSLGPLLSWNLSWLGVGGDSALAAAVHWVLGRISRPR